MDDKMIANDLSRMIQICEKEVFEFGQTLMTSNGVGNINSLQRAANCAILAEEYRRQLSDHLSV